MANSARGEKDIKLGDKTFRLVPDHTAIVNIEDFLNCSIIELFERCILGKPKFKDICAIIYGCTHEEKPRPSFNDVASLVRDEGLNNIGVQCFEMLSDVLSGKKKEVGPDEKTESQSK